MRLSRSVLAIWLGLAIVFVTSPMNAANSQSIEEAHTAYAKGRFLEAADIAGSLGNSEGLALAAKSLTIHAFYLTGGDGKVALFERAAELAQAAISSDPWNAEAHLQSSHVMGRHAQTIGILDSANRGYAEKIHDAIKNALRLDPDMPAAHLSMGIWHSEVVAGVGSFAASLLYGADEDDAIAHFQRALESAPGEKVVPFEYALGLLAMDNNDYRKKARGLLQRAIELPVKDAFDGILHERAIQRLSALNTNEG